MKKSVYSIFALLFCVAMFYSCSKDDSSNDDGDMTVIKGVLMSPDGDTPISGATIFVPEDASGYTDATGLERETLSTDECQSPQVPYVGYTCSQSDGSFELLIPKTNANTVLVVFQSGAFNFTQEVSLTGSSTDFGVVNLDTGSANIAVVTGYYDRMQDILAKLGFGTVNSDTDNPWNNGQLVLGTETFDLYDGDGSLDPTSYPALNELFEDNDGDGAIDLHNYDIVFINCGASETPVEGRPSGPAPTHDASHRHSMGHTTFSQGMTTELQNFVEQGGILYCTDWAYDYVEQSFPAMIDFNGSDGTPADQAEDPNAAQIGSGGIEVQGAILDNPLENWLTGVDCNDNEDCLDADGFVHITSFLGAWAMMDGPHPNANLQTWIEGDVDGSTIPMTVSFNAGSGKVIYSSYHTVEEASPNWRPQERVLQYLVFE